MKKKLISVLTILLMFSMLFVLTGCEEKDDEEEKSSKGSAKKVIEEFVEAINDQDADAVVDLIDTKALGNMINQKVKAKDLESGFEDFFDEHEDFEIEIKKIDEVNEDNFEEELGEDTYDDYGDYEDFIDDMKEQCDVKNLSLYVVKVDYPDEYNEFFDGSNNKDYVFVTKVDGEYKIFYSAYVFVFYFMDMM